MDLHDHTMEDLKRLKKHTLQSFENDLKPLFDQSQRVGKSNSMMHFGLLREAMSYVEYCGAIYVGWSEEKNGQPDPTNVTNHTKSVSFITEVLGRIDNDYERNGLLMYAMYRHGSTHLLRPHRVKSKKSGNVYTWKWYSGGREENVPTDTGVIVPMKHMVIVSAGGVFELPLSMECICNDVREGIELLFNDLIGQREKARLPTSQRKALSFITEGIVERGDIK